MRPNLLRIWSDEGGWILPAIMGVASLFGGASKGQAQERANQNSMIDSQNQQRVSQFGIQQNAAQNALQSEEAGKLNRAGLDLERRGFQLQAPSARLKQALAGSLISSHQPTRLSGIPSAIAAKMPNISGGGSINADTRQLGALLSKLALQKQLEGDNFDPVAETNFQSGLLSSPGLAAYKKPGKLEQILGWGGMAGNVLGTVLGAKKAGGQNDFMAFDNTLTPPPGYRG